MKRTWNNLRSHLLRDFVAFSLIIFILLFILQTVLFNHWYSRIKEKQFTNMSEEIYTYANDLNKDKMNEIAQMNSLVIIIFTTDSILFISESSLPYEIQDISFQSVQNYMGQSYDVITNANEATLFQYDGLYASGALVYGNSLNFDGVDAYIYINGAIAESAIARNINNILLLFTMLFSFIIATVIAFLLSKGISEPITDLNKSVKELATGDYSVQFNENSGVTEISELGSSLNQARDDLSQINNLQKELIANVSHDLRTPLTIIKSYTEMIRDISGEDKEKRNKHLEVILQETDRLNSLVNDVLNLSKLSANSATLQYETIDLGDLIHRIASQFTLIFEKNSLHYEENLLPNVIISCDVSKLSQAIYNFLTNAITYTKDEIKVSLTEDALYYTVTVTDNGDGIKEEDLEHIWDRYYRSQENHVRQKAGSGLGLSIAKATLEKHHFLYGCFSDSGAHFYFKVPKKGEKKLS